MASHDRDNGNSYCAALKLRQHLSKLPQELYDEIYNLTFTAEPKIRVYTKHRYWLAGLRQPAPHVFSDRDATFRGELPHGFPVPAKGIFEQDTVLNEQLPPICQTNRADRNAFAWTFFSSHDSDRELGASAKILVPALNRVLSINELPHLLHANRASRQKFAESFFGGKDSVFVFWWSDYYDKCIQKDHLQLMKDIRIGVPREHFKALGSASFQERLGRYGALLINGL